jgi:hypothetical protein
MAGMLTERAAGSGNFPRRWGNFRRGSPQSTPSSQSFSFKELGDLGGLGG